MLSAVADLSVKTLVVLIACLFALSCQPIPRTGGIDKASNENARLGAYLDSAKDSATDAIPHADSIGVVKIGDAITDISKAQDAGLKLGGDLSTAQIEFQNEHKLRVAAETQRDTLLNSWGHHFQVFSQWAFWIIVVLIAIHVICTLIAPFLPPPYRTIVGIIGKIVNPLGWVVWLAAKMEANKAANTIADQQAQIAANAAVITQQKASIAEVLGEVRNVPSSFVEPTVPYSQPTMNMIKDATGSTAVAEPIARVSPPGTVTVYPPAA